MLLQVDSSGKLESTLIAIDASPFYDTSNDQYRESYLQRDLNKAFIGFLPSRETDDVESNDDESEEDISFYTAATEKSHLTAETDFDTASESLDVPKIESSEFGRRSNELRLSTDHWVK